MNNKYYAVKGNDLARALVFVTGQNYMIFDDINCKGKKIYSFKNTQELREALKILNDLRNKNK